jgi:uncharacterized membrane protein
MAKATAAKSDLSGFNRRQTTSSAMRLLAAAVAGVAAGVVVGAVWGWALLPLVAWVVASAVFLLWTWTAVWPLDGPDTKRLSQREDPSQALADVVLVFAAVAALLAVALVIFRSSQDTGVAAAARIILGVLAVAGAWAVLHTTFSLKYTREYYRDPAGGISFNQDDLPASRDFAYVAFTIGMTFQVSDTNLSTSRIRSLALRHALLAYLFGAVIIAVTINLLAGLSG